MVLRRRRGPGQKVWEVATGREAFRLGPAWQIFREDGRETKIENYPHIIFSPTGQYLAVVAVKGSLRKDNIKELPKEVLIWEVASGRQVASVAQPTKFTLPVFSPPGNTLAVATQENLVHLIDLAGGRELARLKHEGEVRGMSFSSDGQWLATGGKDNTARIWEVPSGREAARLDHPNVVNRVGFSPDSRRLATSCDRFSGPSLALAHGRSRGRGLRPPAPEPHPGGVAGVSGRRTLSGHLPQPAGSAAEKLGAVRHRPGFNL